MDRFLGWNFGSQERETITAGFSKLWNFSRILLRLTIHGLFNVFSRFNLARTIEELKELGKKHGPYFLAYAVCIELVEDVVIPALLCLVGKPHLIPAAIAFHCEPIAYPLYFAVASLIKGRK